MKGFLLDTNIPSELIRVRPESRVVDRVRAADDRPGEMKGFTIHPDQRTGCRSHRVTRNVKDFDGLGAGIFNPWE